MAYPWWRWRVSAMMDAGRHRWPGGKLHARDIPGGGDVDHQYFLIHLICDPYPHWGEDEPGVKHSPQGAANQ